MSPRFQVMRVRPGQEDDLDALYRISLRTGDAGADATALYDDPRLMGHIYVAPYVCLDLGRCEVLEADGRVVGYICGTADTRAFERQLEEDWWPSLRTRYPNPATIAEADRNPDQRRAALIHAPRLTPDSVVQSFPAHIHMNLLPEAQGFGHGAAMLDAWIERLRDGAVAGGHVSPNFRNIRAAAFWQRHGFQPLPESRPEGPVFLGQSF